MKKSKFLKILTIFCVVFCAPMFLTGCTEWLKDSNIDEYTITYDYGAAEIAFDNPLATKTLKSTEWITEFPALKVEYSESLIGWYIKGTNNKIEKYDFIGGDVTLEPKFDVSKNAPSGLYQNGTMLKNWTDIIEQFPDAFKDGYIKQNASSRKSYFIDLNGDLVIDKSIQGIGENAFENCTNLTTVYIPHTLTDIAYNPFISCSNLVGIVVNENNTVYDSRNNCNAIIKTSTNELVTGCKSTIIPNNVTQIGWDAFKGCVGLTSINIPEGLKSIGNYAFVNCGLTSITIPESLTNIGYGPFQFCTELTSIKVNENNTVYDSRDNCNAIIKISTNELITGCKTTVIPSSVTSIGKYAFYGCAGLTSINLPSGITSIDDWAFFRCTGLTSVSIPEGVTDIGTNAFYDCTGLTSLNLPSSVKSIEESAFSNCTNLITITIPKSLEQVGVDILQNCSNLTCIFVDSDEFEVCNNLNINDLLKYPTTLYWSEDNSVTPDIGSDFTKLATSNKEGYTCYVKTNACGLFNGTTQVKTWAELVAEYPEAFATVGEINAKENNGTCTSYFTGLSGKLIIPACITKIGDYAFAECANLDIEYSDAVTDIGSHAFENCISLTIFKFSNDLDSVSATAYDGCTNLKTVVINSKKIADAISVEIMDLYCPYADILYIKSNITLSESAIEALNDITTKQETSDKVGYDLYIRN